MHMREKGNRGEQREKEEHKEVTVERRLEKKNAGVLEREKREKYRKGKKGKSCKIII